MGVLFLCTANSSRSQMAEGYYRSLAPSALVYSAGTAPREVHPLAIRVMDEVGIDISTHRSKSIGEVRPGRVDIVVTLCDDAARCPTPTMEAERVHWPIDDPSAATGTKEELLLAFRATRDEIRANVLELVRARVDSRGA